MAEIRLGLATSPQMQQMRQRLGGGQSVLRFANRGAVERSNAVHSAARPLCKHGAQT